MKYSKNEVVKIDTTEDVEALYQEFKTMMLDDFRAGKSTKDQSQKMMDWMKEKLDMSEDLCARFLTEFTEQLLQDKSIDQQEWRNEK